MIRILITRFPSDPELTHDSTSVQISDNSDFSNILDRVDASVANKNLYISKLVPRKTVPLYARYKRHYSNGEDSGWKATIPLIDNDNSLELVTSNNTLIEMPVVDVVIVNDIVRIRPSTFRGRDVSHSSTTYVVTAGNGEILFDSMYDSVNKNDIDIPLAHLSLTNVEILEFYVIHNGTSNTESYAGIAKYRLGLDSQLSLDGTFTGLKPYKDAKFEVLNPTGLLNVTFTLFKNSQKIAEVIYPQGDQWLIIPARLVEEDSTYVIAMAAVNKEDSNDITGKTITFSTTGDDQTINIDESVTYINEIITDQSGTFKGFDRCTLHGFDRTDFLGPAANSNKLIKYRLNELGNPVAEGEAFGVTLPNGVTSIYSKLFDNGILLLDYVNADNNAEFNIYTYDKSSSATSLIGTIERDRETQHTGSTNSIVSVYGSSTVFYFSTTTTDSSLSFTVLDVLTGTKKSLPVPDVSYSGISTLAYIGNDKILGIFGGSEFVWIYDITINQWNKTFSLPSYFIGKTLLASTLKNADVLITEDKNAHDSGSYQFLTINRDTGISEHASTLPDSPTGLHSNIVMPDGSVYLTNNDDNITLYKFR